MSLCIDAQAELIEKFDKAVQEVIETMIGQKVEFLDQVELDSSAKANILTSASLNDRAMTVVMGLVGGLQGIICISLSDQAAIEWTRGLIDHETLEVDQTVIDAVGELGNIVVGTAKRQLTDYQLSMSLPSVIRGGRKSVAFPSSTKPLRRSYTFAGHELALTIALSMG